MLNITNLKETVESIITNSALTHEQAMIALSDVPLSYVEFFETTNEFRELCEAGCLWNVVRFSRFLSFNCSE